VNQRWKGRPLLLWEIEPQPSRDGGDYLARGGNVRLKNFLGLKTEHIPNYIGEESVREWEG